MSPATKLGQGYVFTRVCDYVHKGVSASVHAWIQPPWEQTPPSGAVHAGRYGQQAGGTHPTGMHTCSFYGYGTFTLTETDTVTEIDEMAIVPNGISVWVQYEHLHTVIYKPTLSVSVSLSVNAPLHAIIKYCGNKFEPVLGNDQLYY